MHTYLVKFHPDFEKLVELKAKQKMWKVLFPQKEFKLKKLHDLMSELTVVSQKFITVHSLNQNEKLSSFATAMAFIQRQMFEFSDKAVSKAEDLLKEEQTNSALDQLLFFFLKREMYYSPLISKAPPAGELLVEADKYLNHFFLIQRLKLVLETKLRARIFSNENALPLDVDHDALKDHKNLLVRIYYHLILLEKDKDLESLISIEEMVLNALPFCLKGDKNIIILTLINHISHVYHKGQPTWVSYLLKMFRLGLEEGIFINSNRIKHTTFLNIAVCAAAANDFEFHQQFTDQYQKFLAPEINTPTICLSTSYLYFHQNEFEKSIEKLNELDYSKLPEFDFRFRNLSIRCLFEKALKDDTYWESLHSKILAFTQYLNRGDILSANKVTSYKNFVSVTNKIMKAIRSKSLDQQKKETLLKEIDQSQSIVSVNWLKEKIRRGDQ